MSERITKSMLEKRIDYLNKVTGSPETPYTRRSDGKLYANIGNYHLDSAYGGYSIERMTNSAGGVSDLFECGHQPIREIYNRLNAFIRGYDQAKREILEKVA